MKILVVDDNEFLASTIQAVLEDEGLDVVSAKDGIEGYRAYLLFNPDLIITDIQMPERNGLEMMELIRTHSPMIKTIYMSGNPSSFWPSIEEEERRYQVNFFEKPFSFESLKKVVFESSVASEPMENRMAACYF